MYGSFTGKIRVRRKGMSFIRLWENLYIFYVERPSVCASYGAPAWRLDSLHEKQMTQFRLPQNLKRIWSSLLNSVNGMSSVGLWVVWVAWVAWVKFWRWWCGSIKFWRGQRESKFWRGSKKNPAWAEMPCYLIILYRKHCVFYGVWCQPNLASSTALLCHT